MSTPIIRLDQREPVKPDSDRPGWWIDHNVVTTRTDNSTTSLRLPRRKPRITVQRLGNGRSSLTLGGFNSTTIQVVGPTDAIDKLREEVV